MAVIHKLTLHSLKSLASSLRDGTLSSGITTHTLQQIAGPLSIELEDWLKELLSSGMSFLHIARIVDAVIETREISPDPMVLFDLVLSGPDLAGSPTSDTAAVVRTLIEEATTEVILVSYAIHNGERLFKPLADKMEKIASLQVVFYLDIPRKRNDTSLSSEIVRRFVKEFKEKNWPWPKLPDLFYDPRSLSEDQQQRSSLHAKCIIIDRKVALVSSANFTEAAQIRNIEAGVVVRYEPFVERLANYFEGLQRSGHFSKLLN
jgi:hypothetical protein